MYTVVGRFRFRPLGQEAMQSMMQGIERDFAPIARGCPGFRGVYFSRPSDEEVMTTWLWDSRADWEAAQAPFGPYLAQHIAPHLAGPPERVTAEIDVAILP
jgi:hypothetical protein